MKRVGTVVQLAQGMIIASSSGDSVPDDGMEVIDERLAPIGKVVDVIGPIDQPYIVIDPVDGVDLPGLLREKIYQR